MRARPEAGSYPAHTIVDPPVSHTRSAHRGTRALRGPVSLPASLKGLVGRSGWIIDAAQPLRVCSSPRWILTPIPAPALMRPSGPSEHLLSSAVLVGLLSLRWAPVRFMEAESNTRSPRKSKPSS